MSGNVQNPNLVSSPNYGKQTKLEKLKRKIRTTIIRMVDNTPLKFRWYRSYWHYRFFGAKSNTENARNKQHYLTQKPNFGAGIGHQMANWNSGLYFAGFYNLKFAHSKFSTKNWENFLGFGEGEALTEDLLNKSFKIVQLPTFDSENMEEIKLVGNIISSYTNENVLFNLELDQGYMRQFDTYNILSDKFFKAEARKTDKIIFNEGSYNVAVHIRRRMKIETTEVWKSRGLENQYFANVLEQALSLIKTDKKIEVYLFSQGKVEEFPEFTKFENMHYCVDMGPVESVLHMVYADMLLSSKSSFSYKPALISKNIQIFPETFWHDFPDTERYIGADNDGNFDHNKLKKLFI